MYILLNRFIIKNTLMESQLIRKIFEARMDEKSIDI